MTNNSKNPFQDRLIEGYFVIKFLRHNFHHLSSLNDDEINFLLNI